MGDEDDADATHEIGGGSIVIHDDKNVTKSGTDLTLIESDAIPTTFVLLQNYPNPFNPETTIRFDMPESRHVTIVIFNTLGQVVRSLLDEECQAGEYLIKWRGRDDFGHIVPGGIYIYRILAGEYSSTRKMVYTR